MGRIKRKKENEIQKYAKDIARHFFFEGDTFYYNRDPNMRFKSIEDVIAFIKIKQLKKNKDKKILKMINRKLV